MDLQSPPENSVFSINEIKVVDFSFKQLDDISNSNHIYLDTALASNYIHIESKKELNPTLSIEITMSSGTSLDNKKDIAVFKGKIIGSILYKDTFNEKLLPNIISILYSYLRPVVAQMSVMAKLPPVDLPILNLSDIKVEKIKPKEKND